MRTKSLIFIALIFAAVLPSCRGTDDYTRTLGWLEEHCGCGKLGGEVSRPDRGTLWEFVLEDCGDADHAAHARSLVEGLARDLDGFCGLEVEISLTYLENGRYEPHVFKHCGPVFQF